MISTGTVTSTGRTCDLRRGGAAAKSLAAAQKPDDGAGQEPARKGEAKPWARYARFETDNGLVLLCEPGPLDRWLGKNIRHEWRSRKFVDRETEEPLTVEEPNDYKRYIHRHNERRATGRSADKLVELVGKHNPRIEEELRIYVGRFPWKVAPLLAEAKKVFLKATTATRSGEQHKEAVTKETDTEAKSKGMKKDKKGKGDRGHPKGGTDALQHEPFPQLGRRTGLGGRRQPH